MAGVGSCFPRSQKRDLGHPSLWFGKDNRDRGHPPHTGATGPQACSTQDDKSKTRTRAKQVLRLGRAPLRMRGAVVGSRFPMSVTSGSSTPGPQGRGTPSASSGQARAPAGSGAIHILETGGTPHCGLDKYRGTRRCCLVVRRQDTSDTRFLRPMLR